MSHTPVALRFFVASYFLGDFFFDGHEKLILAPTLSEAASTAEVSHPLHAYGDPVTGEDIHVEELSAGEFKERLEQCRRADPLRNWLDVAL